MQPEGIVMSAISARPQDTTEVCNAPGAAAAGTAAASAPLLTLRFAAHCVLPRSVWPPPLSLLPVSREALNACRKSARSGRPFLVPERQAGVGSVTATRIIAVI